MMRLPILVSIVAVLVLAGACRTVPREAAAPGDPAPEPAAPASPQAQNSAAPPDVPVELRGVPVTLEELAERLAVRDYRFAGNGGVEVSLVLENRTAEEEFSLRVATSFRDREGAEIFQTRWVPVVLGPRKRHFYDARTGNPFARSATVLVQVLDWPGAEAAPEPE